MTNREARERIVKLTREINDLRYRYHVLNDPDITDEVYEHLTRELIDLEQKYPQYMLADSPTQRVGGKVLEKFRKIKHPSLMLSLNNAFSRADLAAWHKRITKILADVGIPDQELDYFCELKYDGLSISLEYENGYFVRGSTRGDGVVGEDITQNLKTIATIPLKVACTGNIEVRGEVLMPKKVWLALNQAQQKKGAPIFANPRNAAAGSVRQLDPKITASRKLDFFAWDIPSQLQGIKTHQQKHEYLKKLGFKVDQYQKHCRDLSAVFKFIDQIETKREKLDYGTDGVVINVNSSGLYSALGIVGKAPRYAIAYKYPAEKATTILKNIIINVGRTGALTPLAVFEPVVVAGSTIAKATLHNIEQIERLDVRIGDTVVIQKAGEVIPEVVAALPNLRRGNEKKFKMPAHCPVCGGIVEQRSVGEKTKQKSAAYFCANPKCPAKNIRGLEHFVNAYGILAVGPKILRRFKDDGLISDAADLFVLQKEDIAGMERFGEKSAENILASIKEHSRVTLARFIYALGILHVGEQTSEDLANHFGSLGRLVTADLEHINLVENVGPVIAKSVAQYFQTRENRIFIDKLLKHGVSIIAMPRKISAKLSGKTFVITGTLQSMSRDEAKTKIKQLGGRVSEAVSANTAYLVTGSEPGSKLQKATRLGIVVLDEAKFLDMIRARVK